jgi:hypothetical protein
MKQESSNWWKEGLSGGKTEKYNTKKTRSFENVVKFGKDSKKS